MSLISIESKGNVKTEFKEENVVPAPEPGYSFSDFIDINDLHELFDSFSKLTGLTLGIIDSNNNSIASAGWQNICKNFHRVNPETRKYCIESNTVIKQSLETMAPITGKCKNGLYDVGVPISVDGKNIGAILFGQFFIDEKEKDSTKFELQAEEYNFDKIAYMEAMREVPVLSREKVEQTKHFITTLAHLISQMGYSSMQLKKEKVDELKKFNEVLKNLVQKTHDLNVTKDKFFSILAHDLKNPFANLLSSSELLLTYIKNNNNAKVEAKAQMIYSATKHAYSILENLLEWSRSQTGALKLTPAALNLNHIVDECLTEAMELAENKSICLLNNIDENSDVYADKYMLRVIIRNLVTNAIKYTYTGGEVKISAKRFDTMTEITVADTGIGIAKENLEKLFKIDSTFTQSGTANEKGSSLGLILCKEFVEKHNGKIWVESELNKGSEFKFTIPCIEAMNMVSTNFSMEL